MDRPEQDKRPAHQRTRSRGLSFRSDKSTGSKPKVESLRESSEEKHRLNHFSSKGKADPNAAMNEAQPIAAALEASTLGSLAAVQHVDVNGNPITEPDLSNPTRPRWERPLDTIRSFDRAIDEEYRRKKTMSRAEAFGDAPNGYASRRSSYFGVDQSRYSTYSQAGGNGGGYYGSYYGNRNRDSYVDNGSVPMPGPSRNRYTQRMQAPEFAGNRYNSSPNGQRPQQPAVYPTHGYQQSRDTVNTGHSSGSQSEPWANSTGPSSENSSLDRVNAPINQQKPLPDPSEQQYGVSGLGGSSSANPPLFEKSEFGYPTQNRNVFQNPNSNGPNGNFQQGYGGPSSSAARPPVQRVPVPLGANAGQRPQPQPLDQAKARPAVLKREESKRKSWFKRRFSKD